MKSNYLTGLLPIAAMLAFGLACSSLTSQPSNGTAANTGNVPANAATKTAESNTNTPAGNIEKADFTVTSEELYAEYKKKGEDLKKYSNKNIAVTGRVTMLSTEKQGTVQPWVTLFAASGSFGTGVNCYFDDENVEQMKKLKKDKIVKIQGLQDGFNAPPFSPMLKHCVVLEGAK